MAIYEAVACDVVLLDHYFFNSPTPQVFYANISHNSTWPSAFTMALTTTVPVTAEDLLHLPARITFGTWASDWTLLSLQVRKREREREREDRDGE